MRNLLASLVFVMATFGIAFATHPGSSSGYEMVGFSTDSKSVFFKKSSWSVMEREDWFAVWDAATGKQKTSQPVLRLCGPGGEWEKDATCERGDKTAPQIDQKTGDKTIAKIHATHGALAADSLLAQKAKVDDKKYLKEVTSTGHVQVFTGKNVEVQVTTKLEGKKLPDLSDGNSKTVFFSLELTVTAGTDTWTAKTRVHGDPIEDLDNGNILLWSGLYVQGLAVAPDRKAVGFVFAGKPYVLQRKTK
jgi:hypothetical protein